MTLEGELDHKPHTFTVNENTAFRDGSAPTTFEALHPRSRISVEEVVKNDSFWAVSVSLMEPGHQKARLAGTLPDPDMHKTTPQQQVSEQLFPPGRVCMNGKMGIFMMRFCTLFLALFASLVVAPAQTALFTISQNGKPVGTASSRFSPTGKAVSSESLVRVSMKGLQYVLSKNEELSTQRTLRSAILSATVNGSAVSVTVSPASTAFRLKISANGKLSSRLLEAHRYDVFLPDFDPGALQTLLDLANAHNSRDLWAILPKGTGSAEAVALTTNTDEQGTLDGKPLIVHHLTATIAGNRTQLFTDTENHLLQAELQGFALVRQGFLLTPPTRAPAPVE